MLFNINCVSTVVLGTIINQHGDEVITKALSYVPQEDKYFLESLECLSSRNINNGTCRCVNHDTYSESSYTQEEAEKYLPPEWLEAIGEGNEKCLTCHQYGRDNQEEEISCRADVEDVCLS